MLATMSYPPEYKATATRSFQRPSTKATSRQKPQPLDPDELTRRLHIVVAERRKHSERKKRLRAEADLRTEQCPSGTGTGKDKGKDAVPLATVKEKSPTLSAQRYEASDKHDREPRQSKAERVASKTSAGCGPKEHEKGHSSSYRHIPQVAASQFTRTTTVESPTERLLVHKLSKKAMKFHMEGPNANPELCAAGPGASPFEQARALRKAQTMRERQYGRNQPHHMPALATAADIEERKARLPHRHTFETHFNASSMDLDDEDTRRRSTGGVLSKSDPPLIGSFDMPAGLIAGERHESDEMVLDSSEHHRVDWTQSDEARVRPMPIATSPPPLRKPESKWTLRGRLGSFTKHGKDEKPPTPPDDKLLPQTSPKSPKSLKSPKSGFFARFKR